MLMRLINLVLADAGAY